MFSQILSALMTYLQPEALRLPAPTGSRQARAELDAAHALRAPMGSMTLSERRADPAAYRALRKGRRETLLALMLAEPSDVILPQMADCIAAIVEESSWADDANGACFDGESHPAIDLACAETAVLFAWCIRQSGTLLDRLDTSICLRMQDEVRRRVLRPAMIHDDYPFMRGEGTCPMAVCADILVCTLLSESDASRLSRILKPMLRCMDELCQRHGHTLKPLTETLTDISAVTDLVCLLRMATRQHVDLTEQLPKGDWLDELLYPWIQDEWFNDPAGQDMHPALSGGDLFRVGIAADDEPLIQLGAHLYHQNHIDSHTVTGCLMEVLHSEELENTFVKPQRLRYAALPHNLMMAVRVNGLYASIHVGGGRCNAGELYMFAPGAPIFVDGGRIHSVPVLGGQTQLDKPVKPCIADFEVRQDQEILSVDLTNAYPQSCRLRSYQRTVLTLRREQMLRVVDAIDLSAPLEITFRFVTAAKPIVLSDAVRLGQVRMTWEGTFNVSTTLLSPELTLIELTTPQPIRQSFFAFSFTINQ